MYVMISSTWTTDIKGESLMLIAGQRRVVLQLLAHLIQCLCGVEEVGVFGSDRGTAVDLVDDSRYFGADVIEKPALVGSKCLVLKRLA